MNSLRNTLSNSLVAEPRISSQRQKNIVSPIPSAVKLDMATPFDKADVKLYSLELDNPGSNHYKGCGHCQYCKKYLYKYCSTPSTWMWSTYAESFLPEAENSLFSSEGYFVLDVAPLSW